MAEQDNTSKGKKYGLKYAMIPGGFILLVLILVVSGFWVQEDNEEQPASGQQEPVQVE
jgi:hypothetical protein